MIVSPNHGHRSSQPTIVLSCMASAAPLLACSLALRAPMPPMPSVTLATLRRTHARSRLKGGSSSVLFLPQDRTLFSSAEPARR
eukprot:scaffold93016_cov66-Phaeocystis_antarctica.AAC.4